MIKIFVNNIFHVVISIGMFVKNILKIGLSWTFSSAPIVVIQSKKNKGFMSSKTNDNKNQFL